MVVLSFLDDPDSIDFNFMVDKYRNDYLIFIFAHKNRSLKKALSDPKRVELLKKNLADRNYPLEDKEYLINLVSGEDMLKDVVRFEFDFKRTDVESYVRDNPEIDANKVYLCDVHINETFKLFKLLMGNRNSLNKFHVYCSYKDQYDTLMGANNDFRELMSYARKINSLELSPMEKVLYLYEIVREDMSYEADQERKNFISDNRFVGEKVLSRIYAEKFAYILYRMGFKPHIINYKNDLEFFHQKVYLKIKDKKYGIDGTFCFDPTFDAPRKDGLYLNKLEYFAKDKATQEKDLGSYNRTDEDIFIKSFGKICCAFDKSYNFDSISAEKMIDLIHTVRINLFMDCPSKYDYNISDLRASFESNKPTFDTPDVTFDSYVNEQGYDMDINIAHYNTGKIKDFINK